jgi:hypothetical protein
MLALSGSKPYLLPSLRAKRSWDVVFHLRVRFTWTVLPRRGGENSHSTIWATPLQPAFCPGLWTQCSESERGLKPATTYLSCS